MLACRIAKYCVVLSWDRTACSVSERMFDGSCELMKTGNTLWTMDEGVVESRKKVLMSGMMMWVGGRDVDEEGVTKQFDGRKAACVVMPNPAANVTLMSGQCGLQ